MTSFEELGLSQEIVRAVEEMGYQQPTTIQKQAIPGVLAGNDIIGRSQTGTGKTAAFGLPLLQLSEPGKQVQALVLCPTRELAMQGADEMRKFAKYKEGISVAAVYGGDSIERQIMQLKKGASIVFGTPGRVMDHMRRRTLRFNQLRILVLDEADEMLNMGFREDIETILQQVPAERQTLLFSATMPPEIMAITDQYQKSPQLITTNSVSRTVEAIEQVSYEAPRGEKQAALCRILHSHKPELAIIFCNTKIMVDELCAYLNANGFQAEGLHGDMQQSARTQVMERFKKHTTPILVATDVAARGIDVSNVDAVINYDLPQNSEYYIHRIGRTGRAGKGGLAITLISGRRQVYELNDLQKKVRATIVAKSLPTAESIEKEKVLHYMSLIKDELDREGDFSCRSNVEELEVLGYPAADIAAAVMGLYVGRDKVTMAERKRQALLRRDKKRFNTTNVSRLKINIGKSSGVTPNHIMGALTEKTGLNRGDIGKIDISQNDTWVEVPKQALDNTIKKMKGCKIKGIKTITTADSRPERSDSRNNKCKPRCRKPNR